MRDWRKGKRARNRNGSNTPLCWFDPSIALQPQGIWKSSIYSPRTFSISRAVLVKKTHDISGEPTCGVPLNKWLIGRAKVPAINRCAVDWLKVIYMGGRRSRRVAAVCKTVPSGWVGSTPTPPTIHNLTSVVNCWVPYKKLRASKKRVNGWRMRSNYYFLIDFYKKICYNIYVIKIERGNKKWVLITVQF